MVCSESQRLLFGDLKPFDALKGMPIRRNGLSCPHFLSIVSGHKRDLAGGPLPF